jgi:tetratricopeptide (TPR) repeat protein
MLFLLSKTIRNCSFLIAPISALLSFARDSGRKRSRLVPLLALLILAGTAAFAYIYGSYRWQAAQDAVKTGRLEEAKRDLDLCLLVWPRSVPVHLLAARAARLRGEFKDAEAHLNRCLKLNHGASEAIQLEFLLLRVQAGDVEKVVDELFMYVNNDNPESALILETLSRAYMQNLHYGPAFACLSRWQQIAPDSPEPFRWRGWILERMSDRDGAIKEYQEALKRDPDHFTVRFRLAEVYLERNDPLSALPILEQLRKEFPDRADVQARFGQCRFMQGEMGEARTLLEDAVEKLPKDSTALIYLAKIDIQATPPLLEEAEALLRRSLDLDPTDVETQHLLIRCLERQGRSKEAQVMQKQEDNDRAMLKRVSETLKKDSVTDPASITEVGLLFLRAHNEQNERLGLYWLNRALDTDPDYQPALRALVEHYERNGQETKAAVHRRRLKLEKTTASP